MPSSPPQSPWQRLLRLVFRPDDRMVVRPRLPLRVKLLLALLVLGALVGMTRYAYHAGLERAGYLRAHEAEARAALERRIHALEQENARQQELLARAERQLQIDRTAYQELDQALAASTRQIAELREELNFYRNIISPADRKRGVQIQAFRVTAGALPGRYRYKLVLIQAFDHKKRAKGRVAITITGLRGGERQAFQVPAGPATPLAFDFRYYQNLEGEMVLPEGFHPERVTIQVTANRPGGGGRREMDWPGA